MANEDPRTPTPRSEIPPPLAPSPGVRGTGKPFPYAVATLACALAVGALFVPGLGQGLAGLLFFAVLVSAWYGGLVPGLVATGMLLAGMLGIYAAVGAPLPAWQIWALVIFAGLGGMISLIIESMHDARRRAQAGERAVREQAERLREADVRKDEFLAMLAHELRNPLSTVGNAVRLLQMPGAPDENAEWAKDVIGRQVGHLARLIDDLLDVSRITRGKIVLKAQHLDASTVIPCAVDSVRPQVEEKKQDLSVAFEPGTLWCRADPARLEQILVNLLTNATRYTPAGGRIELAAAREGDSLIFRVRDTGIGIPPERLPEMFDLFVQGDRSTARSEGGLGIGLTVVRRLADLHGGGVTATSEGPGRGSEFVVTIPSAPPPEPVPAQAPATEARPSRARILIVDDNVDTARGLARLLKLLGHEIRTAHDGPEAVSEALDYRPEYLLLDIGLPEMDGYEVARRVRDAGLSDLVIIGISGYGQDEDRRRSREAGFNHHLVKPVDYDALISLIAPTAA